MRQRLRHIVERAIAAGTSPGVVVAAGQPGRAAIEGFGAVDYDGGPGVDGETLYDVASLTKPIVTTAILMRLVDRGTLDLASPARQLVPELVADGASVITIAHLAGHASGMPAHAELFRPLWAGESASERPYDRFIRLAGATPLSAAPGTVACYSDLGYALLGAVVERAGQGRLDRIAASLVLSPLGMTASRFFDLTVPRVPAADRAAPTERCDRRGLVRGEVHDENAHAAGGIAGHAGLFSTAADVSRFAAAMVAAADGERGLFAPAVVHRFFSTQAAPMTSWRLGWDTPAAALGVSLAGDRWSRAGVGHLAFTGCSLWLDPPRRRYCAILSNRVHPSRRREGLRELRRAVMDAVSDWLDDPAA